MVRCGSSTGAVPGRSLGDPMLGSTTSMPRPNRPGRSCNTWSSPAIARCACSAPRPTSAAFVSAPAAGASHGRLLMGLEKDDFGDLLTLAPAPGVRFSLAQSVHEETGGVHRWLSAVGRRLRDVDAAQRAHGHSAEPTRAVAGWRSVRDEVAVGVLARRELSSPT